ncbi:MAG TPA: hypothetical protein VK507_24125 [Iamia sp.]|nr:hypothetical protein [Iamia sp.]
MTSTDERLERYLHDRSSTIDLPHAGVGAITRRARRHRRRRTAAVGGVAAAVLLGGTAIALRQPAPEQEVGSIGAAVVDSPLEWSVVPVQAGLGWGSAATSDGSAVYSLSTAAGPEEEGFWNEPRRLYRSADGTDWEDVGLPEGLYASSVASGDGTVYAVGTAAAGGEAIGVQLAASSDGGAGWDTSTVPVDLAALADGFPGTVRVTDAEVAVSGSTTVVAVSTGGTVDPAAVLPEGEDPEQWYEDRDGLVRVDETLCEGDGAQIRPTSTVPATTAPAADPADPESADPDPADPGAETPPASTAPPVGPDGGTACVGGAPDSERLSWADLGLTPEQVAVAQDQTRLFATDASGALAEVQVLPQGSYADSQSTQLFAADDGWWLIDERHVPVDDGRVSTADVVGWHSTDGLAWDSATLLESHIVMAAGVVDGRPLLVTLEDADGGPQQLQVHRVEAGGALTTVGLGDLMGVPGGVGVFGSAVGPLGLTLVVDTSPEHAGTDLEVIFSPDGLRFSRQALPAAETGTRETIAGITVTPDAVKVRLNIRDEGDRSGGPAVAQRLFVGTPAG